MAIFGLIGEHNSELALKKYGISHGDWFQVNMVDV